MAQTEDQKRASQNMSKAKYNDKAYDRFFVVLPKGRKEELDKVIKQIEEKTGHKYGKGLAGSGGRNDFVREAIKEKIEREGFTWECM